MSDRHLGDGQLFAVLLLNSGRLVLADDDAAELPTSTLEAVSGEWASDGVGDPEGGGGLPPLLDLDDDLGRTMDDDDEAASIAYPCLLEKSTHHLLLIRVSF